VCIARSDRSKPSMRLGVPRPTRARLAEPDATAATSSPVVSAVASVTTPDRPHDAKSGFRVSARMASREPLNSAARYALQRKDQGPGSTSCPKTGTPQKCLRVPPRMFGHKAKKLVQFGQMLKHWAQGSSPGTDKRHAPAIRSKISDTQSCSKNWIERFSARG